MKVTRDTTFRPITITIETETELTFLCDLAEEGETCGQWNTSAQAAFESLRRSLKQYEEKK